MEHLQGMHNMYANMGENICQIYVLACSCRSVAEPQQSEGFSVVLALLRPPHSCCARVVLTVN